MRVYTLSGTAVLNVNNGAEQRCKSVVLWSFIIGHIENCRPIYALLSQGVLILIDYMENLICNVAGESVSEGSK